MCCQTHRLVMLARLRMRSERTASIILCRSPLARTALQQLQVSEQDQGPWRGLLLESSRLSATLFRCWPLTGNEWQESNCRAHGRVVAPAADSLEVPHAVAQQLCIVQPALLRCRCRRCGRRASL